MRKRELQRALENERETSERLLEDCSRYRQAWEDEHKRARDFLDVEEALNVALNLNPYYTTKFCPKCATAIEDRQYVQAGKYLPQHLVWTCKCGYVMYTRTSEDTK